MHAQSFLLAFLLIVMSFLSLASASPLIPAEVVQHNRGYCQAVGCRVAEGVPMHTFTPMPTSSSVSVPRPSTTSETVSPSRNANAGVALASHGTLFCILVASFLGTALAL